MKIKITSFLILTALLLPNFSSAQIKPTTFTLRIFSVIYNVKKSQTVHYNLSGGVEESFDLPVREYFNSKTFELPVDIGPIQIAQESDPNFKLDFIHCDTWSNATQFIYGSDSVVFDPRAGFDISCSFNNTAVTPVLIVPGITGTEMFKGSEKLWPDITRMINPLNNDSFMDPLQFSANLLPYDTGVQHGEVVKKETIIIGNNEVTLFDYTYNLVEEFRNQGYVENETLFTFPYDWRYGVSGVMPDGKTNVDLLKEKIDSILDQTGINEVDVIAHSMGGLIVKKYVMDNPYTGGGGDDGGVEMVMSMSLESEEEPEEPEEPYNDGPNIRNLVFVGVPNTGSVKSIKTLLQGDNFGVMGLNDEEIKKLAKNMPAVYDLLPSQEYYNDNVSFLKTINIKAGEDTVEQDLNYQETKSFLIDKGYNTTAILNAENLHTYDFDNFDMSWGANVYSINGCKTATLGKITETTKTNVFGNITTTYQLQSIGEGDGTVALSSAENLPMYDDNVFYAKYADHGKMPSQNGIRQKIVNLITGTDLATDNIITKEQLQEDPSQCQISGTWLWFLSPVAVEIIDQNGNRSGIAQDGSIQSDILGASYDVMGEQKFVFLPTDGGENYTINLKGTGTGKYSIKAQKIINSQPGEADVFVNLPVTPELTGQINLGEQTTLAIGGQTILPTETLTAEQAETWFPPEPKPEPEKITVEKLISDINYAFEQGWIAKKSTRDNLINRLNRATKIISTIQRVEQKLLDKPKALEKIQKIEKRLDAVLGKLMLFNLAVLKKTKAINQEAYDVISSDINWLINNN